MERKRFTERKYPIAAQILRKQLPPIQLADDRLTDLYNYEVIEKQVKQIAPEVSNIDLLTIPFTDALINAWPALAKRDTLSQLPGFNQCDSFIFHGLYVIYQVQKNDVGTYAVALTFEKARCLGYSYIGITHKDEGADKEALVSCIPTTVNMAAMALGIYLFKNYADVETKLLSPDSKTEFIRCSYKNDLPAHVTLLDCKWFTDLVKDTGFMVRGHFRYQVCGPRNADRKLIWVDMFAKDGYHAQAQKDKESAA